jgi:hypothetical protein
MINPATRSSTEQAAIVDFDFTFELEDIFPNIRSLAWQIYHDSQWRVHSRPWHGHIPPYYK